ncbi:MAG TPA: lysylphosphatidylglycerol synthase transmembrane domain-containing protein [Kofleriaceae bacterium]|nr:lysylphosphatidylglycerol synthase transmembrane domain-containing protein [Kofleriaceae bacterium]
MSRRLRGILLLVVAVAVLFAVISLASDVGKLGEKLEQFQWWALGAAAGLAIGNYVIRWFRWQWYLRDRHLIVPAGSSALVFVAGFALAVTPGKIGELVKAYLLRSMHGIPAVDSAPVVVAERVSDLVALLLLAVIGVAIYGVAVNVVIACSAVVVFGLIVLAWPRLAHGIIELVTPGKLHRFRDPMMRLYDGVAALNRPAILLWATPLGAAAWMCECIGFYLVLRGFPGTGVPLGLATLIYAATTIAGALSFLPGGLGVTEGAMTLLLVESTRGVDNDTAVAAAILTRLATLWLAVGLGVIAMALCRRRGGSTAPPVL